MKKALLVAVLVVTLGTGKALAVYGTAGGPAPFLRTGVGARAVSLSGAFTAYNDDSTSSYWNPASLPGLNLIGVSSMFSLLTQDRSYNFFNVVFPTEYGSFGINFINFSIGNIEVREGDTEDHTVSSENANAYFITYAKEVYKNISLGINLKYIHESLITEFADGASFDLGALVAFNDMASFGLVFQDIAGKLWWTTGTTEAIPFVMKLGFLFRFFEDGLKYSIDAEENEFEGVTFKTGLEAVFFKALFLRGGCSYSAAGSVFDFTFGGGIKYRISGIIMQADYAFLREKFSNTLEANHKFSLNLYFPL